ncbi:MAG: serine/threonine protein kinase [Hyalangium sp.]|uniref:serine/threonine protein kinase n=1 Tax=Hyalangium sp. TaxID=2028555 RepID=UPI00389A046B
MIGAVELQPGTLVDGWQIVRALRTGGFGAVHQAEKHGKAVALKVALHREQSGDTGRTHARALREVATLLMMDHPNLIKARGFGYLPDGRVYLVLEYVDGWTLGDWLERMHPTFRELVHVFSRIAEAVAYMHARGVLHRDLKLSNVMIRKSDGEPLIIDLGCATYVNAEELTTTPLPPGTERYRAPEARKFLHQRGRKRGARYPFQVADELFAVGVMLYELLTDPLPAQDHPRPDFADPLANLLPPRQVNPRVPEALSVLVEGLLAHDPARRPESFETLRRKLTELAGHQGPEYAGEVHPPSAQRQPAPGQGRQAEPAKYRGRKPWVFTGVVAAVMLAAAAAVGLARGHSPSPPLPAAPGVPSPGPALPSMNSSPGSTPAPAPALGPAPTTPATAPEEGPTVKLKPPAALPSARTVRAPKAASDPGKPGSPAWCKAVPLAVALAQGCASAQFRPPENFECPPGAVAAMKKLGWRFGAYESRIRIRLDERGPDDGSYWLTLGPVVGVVTDQFGRDLFPAGMLLSGRLYVTEKSKEYPLGRLIGFYDHVEIQGRGKFPVCLATFNPIPVLEAKGDTVKAQSMATVVPRRAWEGLKE